MNFNAFIREVIKELLWQKYVGVTSNKYIPNTHLYENLCHKCKYVYKSMSHVLKQDITEHEHHASLARSCAF